MKKLKQRQRAARLAVARFLAQEAASGVIIAIAAILALIASNSPWRGLYAAFVALPGTIDIAGVIVLAKPLQVWVNDLWMAVFFFLVGLEIKRELVEGELAAPGRLLLPAIAALGGMILPAALYALATLSDPVALRGWAIPAATDIAFALGVALLLGPRVPASLKLFLTAVAIIDDMGAIVVIALFYTADLSLPMLGLSAAGLLALLALNRAGVTRADLYVAVGLLLWLCVLKSGVHATLAGVATALAIPLRDRAGASPAGALEHGLHPWVAFAILPVFAFVNAGVDLTGITPASLLRPVPLGIALGLLAGKTIGVFGASWLLIRLGRARLPDGATTRQFVGTAVLCGIGFTMSLFIGGLAFEGLDPAYIADVKLGVLAASAAAGLLSTLILAKPR